MKHNLFIFASVMLMAGLWAEYGYCDCAEICPEGYTCMDNACKPDPCLQYKEHKSIRICANDAIYTCADGKEVKHQSCKYNYMGITSIKLGLAGPRCLDFNQNVKCGCNTNDDCGLTYLCQSNHECKSSGIGVLAPQKGLSVNCDNIKAESSNKHIVSCSGNFNMTDELGTQYTLRTSSSNTGFFDLNSSSDYIQLSNLRPGAKLNIVWGLDSDKLSSDSFENNYIIVSNGSKTEEFRASRSGTTLAIFSNDSSRTITIKKGGSGNIKVGIKNINYYDNN